MPGMILAEAQPYPTCVISSKKKSQTVVITYAHHKVPNGLDVSKPESPVETRAAKNLQREMFQFPWMKPVISDVTLQLSFASLNARLHTF